MTVRGKFLQRVEKKEDQEKMFLLEEYKSILNKWIGLLGLRFTFLGSAFTVFLIVGNKVMEILEETHQRGNGRLCFIALLSLLVGVIICALEHRLKWFYTAFINRGGQIEVQLGRTEVGVFHRFRTYKNLFRGSLPHYKLLKFMGLCGLVPILLLVAGHCDIIWESFGSFLESVKALFQQIIE